MLHASTPTHSATIIIIQYGDLNDNNYNYFISCSMQFHSTEIAFCAPQYE